MKTGNVNVVQTEGQFVDAEILATSIRDIAPEITAELKRRGQSA